MKIKLWLFAMVAGVCGALGSVTAFAAAVNPMTGDTMNIILFVGIAVVALAGIIFLLMKGKKK